MPPPVFATAVETGAPRSGSYRASENDITTSSRPLVVNRCGRTVGTSSDLVRVRFARQ